MFKPCTLHALLLAAFAPASYAQLAATALPTQGQISQGQVTISQTGHQMQIQQSSQSAIIDWTTYNIGNAASVRYLQPNANAATLNRVASGPSEIAGRLDANGRVFLLNPNGIVFDGTAQVNVGSLVAAAGTLSNEEWASGRPLIQLATNGQIVNRGMLTTAQGGAIVLAATHVNNRGQISAPQGEAALLAGRELRVDLTADGLIQTVLEASGAGAQIDNSGSIASDGGQARLLAQGDQAHIANSGRVQAQTVAEHEGRIYLVAGPLSTGSNGTAHMGGTLDASAPNGGDGGFIETSAARVSLDPTLKVTTQAVSGKTGSWLIDPTDFVVAKTGGDISGATLSANLANTDVTIDAASMGTTGINGDIFVKDDISWSAPTLLRLQAARDVTIDSPITGAGDYDNTAAQSSLLYVFAPGKLTVNAPVQMKGIGNASTFSSPVRILYVADSVQFNAPSTVANGGILSLNTYTPTRSVHIESSPTAGVLSITPEQLATLHATGTQASIMIISKSGDINFKSASTLTPGDTTFDVRTGETTGIGKITVDAPINVSNTSRSFQLSAPNITINSDINTPGQLYFSTPGMLTIAQTASVTGQNVHYSANSVALAGATTATGATTASSASSVLLAPYTTFENPDSISRPVRIEASPTPGTFSVSPTQLATLRAPNGGLVSIGGPYSNLTVAAPLDDNASGRNLQLRGAHIDISAPINLTSGTLTLDANAGGVSINSPITVTATNSWLAFFLSGNSVVRQAANAPLTAPLLYLWGDSRGQGDRSSVLLNSASGGNHIDKIQGSISGGVALDNGSSKLVVASSGLTAYHVSLSTSGTLVLSGAVTATGTAPLAVNGSTTTSDALCNPPCVLPHVELRAGQSLINNVGVNAIGVAPGTHWAVLTGAAAKTDLNGLTPDATSNDADRIRGRVLVSANRVFYTSGSPQPADHSTVEQTTAVAQTSVPTLTQAAPAQAKAVTPVAGGETTAWKEVVFAKADTQLTDKPNIAQLADCSANQGSSAAKDCIGQPPAAISAQNVHEGADDATARPVAKRWALVIGNSRYATPLNALPGAERDAAGVASLLAEQGYEVIHLRDATRADMVGALNRLIREAGTDDAVAIYYAGHGHIHPGSSVGYWLPTDAQVDDASGWLANTDIPRFLKNIPAKQTLLVSDSCFSGALTRESAVKEQQSLDRNTVLKRRAVVVMASGGEEPVADMVEGGHSPFTGDFLRLLRAAEQKNDVRAQSVLQEIRQKLAERNLQTPQYGVLLSSGHVPGADYLLGHR